MWRLAAAIVLVGLGDAPERAAPLEQVPFTLHRGHLVMVRGSIGTARDLAVLLDTGAGRTIVGTSVAAALGLKGAPTRLESFGRIVQASETTIPSLDAGGFRVLSHLAVVTDLSTTAAALQLERLDAILGIDVMRSRSFAIDFGKWRLVFDALVSTRHEAPFLPHPIFPVVEARLSERRVQLMVDTGASHLVLFRPTGAPTPEGRVEAADLAGGAQVEAMLLEYLRIGTWSARRVTALTTATPGGKTNTTDGLLGLPALGARYVQFDFVNERLGWSP